MNRFASIPSVAALVVLGLLATASPNAVGSAPRAVAQEPPPELPTPAPSGGASAQIGQPNSTKTVTFTVEMTYADSLGVKKPKTFEAEVNVKPANPNNPPPSEGGPVDAPDEKAKAFADELNKKILEHAAAEGWPAGLGVASSAGNVLTVNPGADVTGGPYSDAKIKKVSSSEQSTGQKDRVANAQSLSLGEVEISGDITGLVADTAGSWLWVATNLGEIQITLNAQMRRGALLQDVRDQLEDLGLTAWHDRDRDAVFVLLDDEVNWFGASSNDNGLRVNFSISYP